MNETVDPFEFIDPGEIDRELEEAIRNPFYTDFRKKGALGVRLRPENPRIDEIAFDICNRNISINYKEQMEDEEYTIVEGNSDYGLVESKSIYNTEKGHQFSQFYYLVTQEETFFHTGDGYIEIPVKRPREAYNISRNVLENFTGKDSEPFRPALELENRNRAGKIRAVPLPQD